MSYDFVLLPPGAVRDLAEVDRYLIGQQGQSPEPAAAELVAELERRNGELPEADSFIADPPDGCAAHGATVRVATRYDSIGFLRALLFELATPRGYVVYDPQLDWLMDPAGHLPLAVSHGGAGAFPYLTERLAHLWVESLTAPDPYLVVDRGPQEYIQTYREESGEYTLEYRDGAPDRHFGTTVADAGRVADLIWDWARGDRTRLEELDWQPVEF